jgi:lipopolysaccharide biosynthesis glycosyltransferase
VRVSRRADTRNMAGSSQHGGPVKTCPHNGSFVTLLNSESYVWPALCLRKQMDLVQSVCPLLLLYDDRAVTLSDASLTLLKAAYGKDQIMPISTLVASYRAPKFGRRLYSDIRQTHAKLWIWALPPARFPRVAYMDLDVLVVENIDDVLAHDMQGKLLAATACNPKNDRGRGWFVAGFLVIVPSVSELPALLLLQRFSKYPWNGRLPGGMVKGHAKPDYWANICAPDDGCSSAECLPAAREFPNASDPLNACMTARKGHFAQKWIELACAPKIGDQSIHNHHFRGRSSLLPASYGLNVPGRGRSEWNGSRLVDGSTTRLLHFFGEPKPFDPHWSASLPSMATVHYRTICPITHRKSGPSDETISIAIAADAPVWPGVAGVVRSALTHSISMPLQFHLITRREQLSAARRAMACYGLGAVRMNILAMNESWVAGRIRVIANENMTGPLKSPLNFARFYLSRLLPSLDRVIYLDADVIVQADLAELWRVPLPPGIATAAVPRSEVHFRYKRYARCCASIYAKRYAGKRLDESAPTFNAGVLLMDLRIWERLNLTADIEWWMAQHKAAEKGLWQLGSQPVLHLILHGRWAKLPEMWNVDGLGRLKTTNERANRNARLLHWTGRHKPWLDHGYHTEYFLSYVPKPAVVRCYDSTVIGA